MRPIRFFLVRATGTVLDLCLVLVALLGALSSGCGGPPRPGGCGGGTWRPGTLELHHLGIGQADAALIVGPTGRSLLVDAGEPSGGIIGGRRAGEAAAARAVGEAAERVLGCRHVDTVVMTHFHADHVGWPGRDGLWHLVAVQGFTVGRTLHRDVAAFPAAGATAAAWGRFWATPAAAAFRPEVARVGTAIDLGPGVAARVVAVDGAGALGEAPSENDLSVALTIRFGSFDYFTGGDLSGESFSSPAGAFAYHDVESAVVPRLPDVDVYRANHHGSAHSSGPAFLAQLAPEVSIVSAGLGNPYGHPHPAARARLAARGPVHVTDAAGAVVVRTDGRSYTVNEDAPREAVDPPREDLDRDGVFAEADPDDRDPGARPRPRGGCEACAPHAAETL